MSQRKRALFVSYGGGHIAMVQPVIAALERDCPEIECLQIALTTAYLKANAVRPAFGYQDFLDLVDAPAALAWGERLLPGNTSPDVPLAETRAYLGINYLDLMAQHGAAGAAEYYRQHGRFGFMPRHFMRRVLDKLAPDVVVATNSPRSERAALEAAIERGIASVGMVDLFGQEGDNYIHRSLRPDWTCVIAAPVRERLVSLGFPPERVRVTGSPAFDGLFAPSARQAARDYLDRLGWGGLTPILWAGHREPLGPGQTHAHGDFGFALDTEAQLRAYVRQRADCALIVRYHPGQWNEFPRLPAQERVHFSVPSAEPIHPVILAARAVVVQNSTVGLEAAVAGRAVVSLEYAPSVRASFSLAKLGVSTPCSAADALGGVLSEVLGGASSPPDQYRSDGGAAGRVAALIAHALARAA